MLFDELAQCAAHAVRVDAARFLRARFDVDAAVRLQARNQLFTRQSLAIGGPRNRLRFASAFRTRIRSAAIPWLIR